ncbi:MAG: hypothetical protein IJW53_02705 [Clostridia bacterium]|nr:hypothetical protein [Clostridia bacterium]
MANNFLWVTKTEENLAFYADSAPKSNLSLHFASDIDPKTKKCICNFVRYLRKEFYFPIRCNVYFCNQEKFRKHKGGYSYGMFFSNHESGERAYPQIYIPTQQSLCQIYDSLSHELTHYFQWYFYDDKEKNNRSLEIQASKYASRISQDYCWYHCKEPDSACNSCCGK